MENPRVTVLMPVYNGERYLSEAIESILNQTFTDFEFLIIDDGSTDRSFEIMKSYEDNRIRSIKNKRNIGLNGTLNRGIDLARGQYIARMDCDDISLPDRLELQVDFLNRHPDVCAVAAKTILINADGSEIGHWESDFKNTTYSHIYAELPKNNCIAHPGVMIKRNILFKYKYNNIFPSQDYELWLRLVSDGLLIKKIDKPLIKLRIHASSITSQSNKKTRIENVLAKNIRTKMYFVTRKVIKFKMNNFTFKVLYYLCVDSLKLMAIKISKAKNGFLVQLGKIFSTVIPLHYESSLFFFFPYYHIGGAEKVHADIIDCIPDKWPWIFFTSRSKNDKFKFLFEKKGKISDVSFFALHKRVFYPIYLGIIAKKINKSKDAIVIGGNSTFFYDLLPYIRNDSRKIDLIHAFGGGIENYSLDFIQKIDIRVVTNQKALIDLKEQYINHAIDPKFAKRINLIENKVFIPNTFPVKPGFSGSLKVLYVGRGSKEKRVHLIARTAYNCRKQNIQADFIFVGDVIDSIEGLYQNYCDFRGEVGEEDLLQIYEEADIIVCTSAREGFPLSLMESMAHGVVPVATAVGGIPYYITHKKNGILIFEENEEKIVSSLTSIIKMLIQEREFLMNMSKRAYQYAIIAFNSSKFCMEYRKLIFG